MSEVLGFTADGTPAAPLPPVTPLYGYPLPREQRPPMERNALGQYLLPHPVTGQRQSFTRMTELVHTLDDDWALSQWQRRQWATGGYVCGASHGHGSAEALMPWDTRYDRDKIADAAEAAVDMGRAAEFGTAVHAWTEVIDQGEPLAVVPDGDDCVYIFRDVDAKTGQAVEIVRTLRQCVGDYIRIRSEAGLSPVPGHTERTVFRSVPTGLFDAEGQQMYVEVVGTYDRIYVDTAGRYWLGDVKTSKRLDYSYNSFSAQLEGYAGAAHLWDADTQTWGPAPWFGDGLGTSDTPSIHGLVVMSVPSAPTSVSDPIVAGTRVLDRERGNAMLELAARLRVERRKARARDLSSQGPQLTPPSGAEAIRHRTVGALQACTTLAEAARVFGQNADSITEHGLSEWAAQLATRFPL